MIKARTIRRHKLVSKSFTLEYWEDDGWFVGRLKEVPGVFSQGATISELEDNIKDAYRMMIAEDRDTVGRRVRIKAIGVEV